MKEFYNIEDIRKSIDFATSTLVNAVDVVAHIAAMRDDDEADGYVIYTRKVIDTYVDLFTAALSTDESFGSV